MTGFDWIVIVAYLGGVVTAGLWLGRKKENMEDYFLGGRNIPWGAAMLSMVATEISAATFLGAPEQGYIRDMTYLQFGIGSILARFALAFLFMSLYYKLRVVTVYGFLNHRFGFKTKNSAAGAFLLGRFFAGGSRLFIASLAVKVVTGVDMATSIIILGAMSIFYTFFGGIKAVIWTDVIQAIVLISGAFISIFALLGDIQMPFSEIWAMLSEEGKFLLIDTTLRDENGGLRLYSNAYHFIPAILGGFFLTMATHGTDQAMIQRLLTCKDSFRGKLSMISSGFLGIGVTILFMFVGMLLFVYVQTRLPGDEMLLLANELSEKGQNGNFYLHYILEGLPPGVSGIIIASVLAAAMSSTDSELNAMSATFVNDFYIPYFNPNVDERTGLKISRYTTMVCGVLLVGVAVMIAQFYANNPETDLLSIALGVMTYFYGGLLGLFLVGMLTAERGNALTNIIALVGSTILVILLGVNTQLAWSWNIIIGTLVTFGVAAIGKTSLTALNHYRKAHSDAENT